MSDKYIPEVYLMYLPENMRSLINRNKMNLNLSQVMYLEELEKAIPLDDIFFLVYQQTRKDSLVSFMSNNDLFSFLSHPKNISWMSKMENKYSQYLQKNGFDLKTDGSNWETPFHEFDVYTDVEHGIDAKNLRLIILKENDVSTEVTMLKEIVEERKRRFASSLYDLIGMDGLRTHPVAKQIL